MEVSILHSLRQWKLASAYRLFACVAMYNIVKWELILGWVVATLAFDAFKAITDTLIIHPCTSNTEIFNTAEHNNSKFECNQTPHGAIIHPIVHFNTHKGVGVPKRPYRGVTVHLCFYSA